MLLRGPRGPVLWLVLCEIAGRFGPVKDASNERVIFTALVGWAGGGRCVPGDAVVPVTVPLVVPLTAV